MRVRRLLLALKLILTTGLALAVGHALLGASRGLSDSEAATGNTTEFVIGESDGDISRRIRALISYMFVSKVAHAGAHVLFVWDINSNCPGHFLEGFRPIRNVTFISSATKTALAAPMGTKVYPSSWDTFERTMYKYGINNHFPTHNLRNLFWEQELMLRKLIVPNRDIIEKATNFVRQFRMCQSSAIHVRRTDALEPVYKWIDGRPADEPIYLITDNRQVQQQLLSKFSGNRIFMYRELPATAVDQHSSGIAGVDADVDGILKGMNWRLHDPRVPDMEHLMVDLVIAAHATDLLPSPGSTLGELVKWFRILFRAQWCSG